MSNKRCPLMSKPVATSFNDECPNTITAEIVYVDCQEHNCQLWCTAYTTENTPIQGCAFELNANKNQDGKYIV